jgi:serine/threonine-protein kinase
VDAAVQVAMAKLPADRFASAAQFADALVDQGFTLPAEREAAPSLTPVPLWRRLLWPGLTAAALVVAWLGWQRSPPRAAVARVQIEVPEGHQLAIAPARSSPFDISPDGTRLAFLADSGSGPRILVRDLASFAIRALEGTEGAAQPFFSPDGSWIGFFRDGSLFRVAVAGGAPISIAATKGQSFGGSWGSDGHILIATDSGLFRVEAPGSAPVPVPLGSARYVHWPHLLPGGKHALVATDSGTTIVDLAAASARRLLAGADARYVPTGHLVYLTEDRRVRAVPFDLGRLQVTGPEFAILDNVFRGPGSGAGYFALAPGAGTLVYVEASFNRSLVWVDRNGRETAVPAEPRGYRFPAVSPDGRYAALTVDPRPSDLWIVDLVRGSAERQQTAGHDGWGVWSPEGKRVGFLFGGGTGLGWRAFPFVSDPVRIEYRGTAAIYPNQWLAGDQLLGYSAGDVVTLSVRDGSVRRLVATAAIEQEPAASPDGRWLAYQSDASGSNEIYVQAFSEGGERQVVSTRGGNDPVWSADGSELFYRRGNSIMAVPVRGGPRFQVLGPAVELFTRPYDFTQSGNWTLGPNGRFLMIKGDPATTTRFQVVLNWFEELKENRSGSRRP